MPVPDLTIFYPNGQVEGVLLYVWDGTKPVVWDGSLSGALAPLFITGATNATFTAVAAVSSKKIKIYSLSLMTTSATAVTITFKSAANGTAKATYLLQSPASIVTGISEGLPIGSVLFETAAGELLEMAFSASVNITYNIRYWVEA
mgnify:CR=1 FL=1